ncbi:MAG: HlyC/CorC family transporter [Ruminococcaceae bacterium]|nr:HlyC/CorC family transporter [Oscillospiraceae bacterium]
MFGDGAGWQIPILIILVAMSAFFSGTETAFTSFNKTRMKTLAQDGNKRAKSVLDIEEKYEKFLSTMLVGNNIVNIAATTISTIVFTQFMGGKAELGATVATVVMTVVVLLFGEITPKTLAKDFSEKYTMATCGFVKFLMVIFTPFTLILASGPKKILSLMFKKDESADNVTEDEILTLVEEAEEDGEIDEHESELIKSAIEFNDLEVDAILTPRVDIIAISSDTPIEEILDTYRQSGFSRLPVYEETIDNIIGVIHEKDFNKMLHDGGSDINEIVHGVICITGGMKISKLLREFQSAKTHMAVVVDEYGGTAGLVTLEDVLEGLVGEIWDEHDEVIENIKQIDDVTYIINASSALVDIADICVFSDEELEANATVNGFVLDNINKVPEVGDVFDYENFTFEVIKVDGRRAEEIKLTINPAEDEDEEDNSKKKSKDDGDDKDDKE